MAGFLYYFPDHPDKVVDTVPEGYGLDHMEGASLHCAPVTKGPENTHGLIVVPEPHKGGAKPSPMGYYPDRQRWHKVEGEKVYWIGWLKDDRPGPADVARPERVEGHLVKLGDGREWLVPAMPAFPKGFRIIGGKPELTMLASLEPIADHLMAWANAAESDDDGGGTDANPLTYVNSYMTACRLLAVNYRLSMIELSHDVLSLVTTQNVCEVIRAGLDVPAILAELEAKKKIVIPPDG